MIYDLSVIIPARNEENNILSTIINLEKSLDINHEAIVINDFSTDKTREVVDNFINEKGYSNLRILDNQYSPGLAGAFKTGMDASCANIFVFLMGDSCDSIPTIKDMYKKINEGFSVVSGSRYMKSGSRIGGSQVKAFFSWFVGQSMHFLIRIPTHDISNNFKMYKKSAVKDIDIQSKSFESALEIALKLYFKGYRVSEVPTIWEEKRKGKSNFRMFKQAVPYLKWYFWGIGMKIKTEIKRCCMR